MLKTLHILAAAAAALAAPGAAHAQLPGMGGYGQEMCDRPDLKYPRTGDPAKDKKAEQMEADMRAQKAAMCKPGGPVLGGGAKVSKAPAGPPPSPSPASPPPGSGLEGMPANYTEVTTFDQAMADCKSGRSKKSQEYCDAVAAAQKDELRYKKQDKCNIIRGQQWAIKERLDAEGARDVGQTVNKLKALGDSYIHEQIRSDLSPDARAKSELIRKEYKDRSDQRSAQREAIEKKIAGACG